MTDTAFVILTAHDPSGGADTRIIQVPGAAASEIVARAAQERARDARRPVTARAYVPVEAAPGP